MTDDLRLVALLILGVLAVAEIALLVWVAGEIGVLWTLLVLLALAFTVRDRPRPDEHETRSAAAAQHRTGGPAQAPLPAIGVAGLMRSGLFWTVSIAAALGMAVPTAISDWMIWKPLPSGSAHGSRKAMTRALRNGTIHTRPYSTGAAASATAPM